ncbi:xanthan lyase [Adhaeribacter aerolatus]|uniref:Xanthan lyase n=1 Tax=Adhaeribacter aerolatus TaxID=670289 RepID=A0A512AV58_9BACT|nr:FAD-dependent oxidoreductase [Adhaeribacter aerolatus]GEO03573.1 xanthan lyase [Adhaeribacter aerolatus]
MIAAKQLFLFIFSLSLIFINGSAWAQQKKVTEVDICIYGGTSAGIIAAYTAKKMGKSVLLIEPGKFVGGMTTGGLGATDIGNKYAVTGLAKNFYRRIGSYYGKFEQWTFEPHVAEKVFADFIREGKLDIMKSRRVTGVKKEGEWIREIVLEDAQTPVRTNDLTVKAKMFMDCTYEGDLMARAGVSYTVGRESNAQYGETYNGVQVADFHQFSDGVDPYEVPGDPESGLLWGISPELLSPTGTGDKKVQAYNFRLCLTQDKNNLIPFTQPANYNPAHYELLARNIAKESWKTIHSNFTTSKTPDGQLKVQHTGGFLIKNMPNGKTDFNNFGGFSTDMIGMNYDYPEADYGTRQQIWQAHEDYTKGLLYFVSHDPRVPAPIRQEMQTWGYPKDEFKETGGFPNQLYVREARRMIGEVVMTQKHCEGAEVVPDVVGMAAYGMDSHNIQRVVVNGMVKNEGDVQKSVSYPYPIAYRAITPKRAECANLLVPVCLSASHIAYGSIRMEPVFMVLGQSAATAAVMAIDAKVPVQQVDVARLQQRLTQNPLVDNRPPEILVDNDDNSQVKVTGSWVTARGGYGRNRFQADAPAGEIKGVKYSPAITKSGKYQIYTYLPKIENRTNQTAITIFDGKKENNIILKTADVKEIGLSSGEWASLGTYRFTKGKNAYVEISNKGADGVVIADAVILVPVK